MNQRRKPVTVTTSRVSPRRPGTAAFTLIEMSIVLVIIGLVVGGVLVGQSLINAAALRATISQIEKYQTAVNTFRTKYDALPGDIADPGASSFGFIARGTSAGEGDGNGVIEGVSATPSNSGTFECTGETAVFWRDLSTAGLIEGGFNAATTSTFCPDAALLNSGGVILNSFFPQAKLGGGNYIYVWSTGGQNYFALANVARVAAGYEMFSSAGLTAAQAMSIDSKVDDGLPQAGHVTARLVYANSVVWVGGGGLGGYGAASSGFQGWGNPTTAATPGSSTTCYDNGNVVGPQQYSLAQNTSNLNCALSFQFQ